MYVPGDKYRVFYSTGGGTMPYGDVVDNWQQAKERRNKIFYDNVTVRAAWVMKHNPSQNTIPSLYGSTLRRTKHDVRRLLCTGT